MIVVSKSRAHQKPRLPTAGSHSATAIAVTYRRRYIDVEAPFEFLDFLGMSCLLPPSSSSSDTTSSSMNVRRNHHD